ncbi:MAG: heavy-metal-associated domain-containing protein [Thermoanaerobaculia bacterium]
MKLKKMPAARTLAAMTLLLALAGSAWPPPALAAEGKTSLVTAVFKVEGMTCGGCETGVRVKVKKLDGVEEVEASYEKKRARVTYDPRVVTPKRIIEAIEELGYSAELVTEKTPARGKPGARS